MHLQLHLNPCSWHMTCFACSCCHLYPMHTYKHDHNRIQQSLPQQPPQLMTLQARLIWWHVTRSYCTLPVWTMNTPMTKKVNPTKNGSATHPRLKLFLRRSTNVRTPRNKIEVAMKAKKGDTNQDRMIGTIPCKPATWWQTSIHSFNLSNVDQYGSYCPCSAASWLAPAGKNYLNVWESSRSMSVPDDWITTPNSNSHANHCTHCIYAKVVSDCMTENS